VLHSVQMSNTLTVRLPPDLAEWLDRVARETGTSRGSIIRRELEKSRQSSGKAFLRLAGAMEGPANLSVRKGFSKK
jgi:predicted transcriptional regulator